MKSGQRIAVEGRQTSAWNMDVADSEDVARVFREIAHGVGPADILVTSAGIPGHGDIVNVDDELWKRVMEVDLFGVFYCMRESLKQMIPNRSGIIVNVSSICGIMDAPARLYTRPQKSVS